MGTHSKPEINPNSKTKCRVDELGALPDEAAVKRHVRGHFTDGGVLRVDDNSVYIISNQIL